jgi:hypothetical protein
MTEGPITKPPDGTLAGRIHDKFREAAGHAFERVPDGRDATNAELASAIKALWEATEYSLRWIADAIGNPSSEA